MPRRVMAASCQLARSAELMVPPFGGSFVSFHFQPSPFSRSAGLGGVLYKIGDPSHRVSTGSRPDPPGLDPLQMRLAFGFRRRARTNEAESVGSHVFFLVPKLRLGMHFSKLRFDLHSSFCCTLF